MKRDMSGEIPTKEQFRAMVHFEVSTTQSTGIQVYRKLYNLYSGMCHSLRTIQQWTKDISGGEFSLNQSKPVGRPKSDDRLDSIESICSIIRDNPTISIRDICAETGLSFGTTHSIIHEDLGLRICSFRYVPYNLTSGIRRQRVERCHQMLEALHDGNEMYLRNVITGDESWFIYDKSHGYRMRKAWVEEGSSRVDIPRPGFRQKKVMLTIFFSMQGILLVKALPKGMSINSEY